MFAGGAAWEQAHPRNTWGLTDYLFLGATQMTLLSREAVIVFFVLSGFSIAYSLARRGPVLGFYVRRLVRLYPPYLVGLVWAAAAFVLLRSAHPELFSCTSNTELAVALCDTTGFLEPTTIMHNLFYDPSGAVIGQYWSLPHELIFYALVPLLLLRRTWYLIASAVLFVLSFAPNGLAIAGTGGVIGDFVLAYNPYFAVGVLLFAHWERALALLRRGRVGRTGVAVLAVTTFLAMIGLNLKLGISSKPSAVLAALLACVLLAGFHLNDTRIRPLVWVGKFSYTLYLTHLATLFVLMSLVFSFSAERPPEIFNRFLWIAAIPVSVVVAWGLYFVAERWSKQMIDAMRRTPQPAPEHEPPDRRRPALRLPAPKGAAIEVYAPGPAEPLLSPMRRS